jgi:hypothetical protein
MVPVVITEIKTRTYSVSVALPLKVDPIALSLREDPSEARSARRLSKFQVKNNEASSELQRSVYFACKQQGASNFLKTLKRDIGPSRIDNR